MRAPRRQRSVFGACWEWGNRIFYELVTIKGQHYNHARKRPATPNSARRRERKDKLQGLDWFGTTFSVVRGLTMGFEASYAVRADYGTM
jgi:hypothetical protein